MNRYDKTAPDLTRRNDVTLRTLQQVRQGVIHLNARTLAPDVTKRVGEYEEQNEAPQGASVAANASTQGGSTLAREDRLHMKRIAPHVSAEPTRDELLRWNNTALSLIEHQPWSAALVAQLCAALHGASLEQISRLRQAG